MQFDRTFEHGDELLSAALAEFIAQGYDQASINTILKNAGMSKGQFYYHFKNKEGLYLALIGIMIGRKQEFLAQVMQPADLQADIFTVFKIQVRHSMAFAAAFPVINHFAESFLREKGNPIYDKALARYNFADNQAMNRLIEGAYNRGDFREDLPLPFIKKTIGHLFTHFGDIISQDMGEEWQIANVEEDLTYLIDFMRNGLSRTPMSSSISAAGPTRKEIAIGQPQEDPTQTRRRKEISDTWDIWQT